jgi:predicted nucleotidyltransferase
MYGLETKTLESITNTFSKFPEIEKVILYGSRAKGNFKNGSDIDLTFIGSKLNLTILNKIALVIDDLLLPYSFDMSIFEHINNAKLIEHIHRVGKCIYTK